MGTSLFMQSGVFGFFSTGNVIMEQIFVSSVQKELQADRYAVRDFVHGNALLCQFFRGAWAFFRKSALPGGKPIMYSDIVPDRNTTRPT